MRKMMLLAVMMGLAAMMLVAAPASAQDLDGFCEDFDGDFFCDEDDFFVNDFFVNDFFVNDFFDDGVEQEAESGDVDQSFDVSQTGDNSNQTASIQGTANTGNAQNVIDVVDAGDFGDFDGDRVFVNDNDGICEDDDDEDCFLFGDDVFFGDDGVFVFGDDNGECDENGDDEDCIVIVDDFFGDDDDVDFIVRDDDLFDDGTEFEFEDFGADIEL